jgi:hypothetical protein
MFVAHRNLRVLVVSFVKLLGPQLSKQLVSYPGIDGIGNLL